MFPTTTQERRRSWNTLSSNENWRPRSASTGVIEISPFNRNLANSQRTPATPCFVSPRMAFSTRFSYDSPIQVLTSSSPCVFKPMSVRNLRKRCSMSRLPPRCKILLIVLLLSLSASLYYIRNIKEGSTIPCTDESCSETTHEEGSLQSFHGTGYQPSYHSLTQDLDNPYIEMPNAPSMQELPHDMSYDYNSGHPVQTTELEHPIEGQTTNGNSQYKTVKVSGVYMEEHNPNPAMNMQDSFLVNKPDDQVVGWEANQESSQTTYQELVGAQERERSDVGTETLSSGPEGSLYSHEQEISMNSDTSQNFDFQIHKQDETLAQYPRTPEDGRPFQSQHGAQSDNFHFFPNRPEQGYHFQPQNVQSFSDGHKQQLSDLEIEARIVKHSMPPEYRQERSQNPDFHRMPSQGQQMPMGYMNGGAPYGNGGAPHGRNEPMRFDAPQMDRLPPGVNPRRYRHEF